MNSSNKILIGIVVGILLLITIALIVTLMRPDPTYQTEDMPEGITHNYLLALQNEDYERAYQYLSPALQGYPTSVKDFQANIADNSRRFNLGSDATLSVLSAIVNGDTATVTVRESRFQSGDLFDSSQSTYVFEVELSLEANEWKIVNSSSESYRASTFFAPCWRYEKGCK